ncbi:unnamed protein product [Calypogeia fissa]
MRDLSHGRLASFLLLLQLVFASSAFALQANNVTSKRAVYYYQTVFSSGHNGTDLISLLPLVNSTNRNKLGKPYTTDVLVGAFHLGPESDNTTMHLNGLPPSNPIFYPLWNQTAILQKNGVNVNMFLGGYVDQSFVNLAANFSYYYPILKQNLLTYKFNGVDLDVEDLAETTAQIEKLINQLRTDFGTDFVITLAPVATDMTGQGGLSNIDYKQLYTDLGSKISWFNVQFYSGYGSLATPLDYTTIVSNGFPANIVVAGMLSNQANGDGYVDVAVVRNTVETLLIDYATFGGVDAFEYFNAEPGGTADPAAWATYFGKAMGE